MPQQPPELNGALAQGVSTKAATTEEIGDVIGRIHRELQLLLLERAAIVKRIGTRLIWQKSFWLALCRQQQPPTLCHKFFAELSNTLTNVSGQAQ